MRKKLTTQICYSLSLLILAAQPATWGETAVTCNDSSFSQWTNPVVWGESSCFPNAGVCDEPDWSVTIGSSCFVYLNASPSLKTLTLSGFVFNDGQPRSVSVSGMTTLATGQLGGDLIASGPLEISSLGGDIQGTLHSISTVTMRDNSIVSGGVFQNDGDFHKVGIGTSSGIFSEFNSSGPVEVEFGTLTLGGGGVATNLVEVWSGTLLRLSAPYTFYGGVVSRGFFGSGVVQIDAHLDQVNSAGTWTAGLELLEGNIHFAVIGTPASVAMSYGTLTGDLRIEGPLDWTGGTMAAPGTTWITTTADVTDDSLDPRLDGRQLVVETGATLNIWRLPASTTGNGIWGFNGASVLNRGTVNVVDGIPLFAFSPADALFKNDGLFEKTTLNGATVQFEFLNHGTVHVKEGFLEFVDGYVQSVNPLTLTIPVTQLGGGSITDAGGLIDIQEGYLQGAGAIYPAVHCTGVISPGVESPDILSFLSPLTLGPGAALEFELGGLLGGEEGGGEEGGHDRIAVLESINLDGDLLVTFVQGFENGIQPGDTFDLVTVLSTGPEWDPLLAIQGQLAGQPSGSQLLTADGHGSFTVEYGPGASFPHLLRLTNYQPATPNPAGSVPDGDSVPGLPLLVEKATGAEITLTWGSSCSAGDTDYEIYQGEIGDYYSHVKMDPCSTAGATFATFAPPPLVGTYYLVVPTNGTNEGSYGLRSGGTERPQPQHAVARCRPQQIAAVCP